MKPTENGVTMMTPAILVTGGAGYVGSHTVTTLLERQSDHPEFDIVVIDNLSNAYKAAGQKKPEALRIIEELTNKTIHFYELDIRNKEGLSEIFEKHNIECVIHFAALKAVGESVEKPLEYYQANISGTCTLLEQNSCSRVTMMTPAILVTGGAGYVGSHTVTTLLERQSDHPEFDIVVIDNLSNAYKAAGQKKPEALRIIEELTNKTIHFYELDIRNKEGLSEIFEKHNIECVIHFAALKAVGESVEKPLEYYQANISGTCTLLEVMRKYGVYKLVYSSSCTVYGEPERLPIDEGHNTGRGLTSPYGKSKYFCEEIMKDLCTSDQKWKVISLRYFNPVGAHRSGRIGEDPSGIPNNLMPFIAQVAVGRLQELKVFGNDYPTVDGTGVRDYIHVEDLAEGHVKAVKLFQQPGFSGFHAVNLGTGTGYSVLQMIAAFQVASGREVPYRIVGRRAGDIAANYADVGLSHRLLAWRATRTLEDMCADTWRWQSNNPEGFKTS